jgi:branched-subunit amino acid aminotransferase/4-amino-4-deoxychorismate lyase
MSRRKINQNETVITSIDGVIVPHQKALISVYDNSFLYAQGLFETFLGIGDKVMFEKDHLDRLWRGAKVIDLKIPCSRATLSDWMRAILKSHPAKTKKLRLTVTAGDSARWLGIQGKPRLILIVGAVELPTRPFELIVSKLRVDHRSMLRRIKTVSYALQATALKEAKHSGADDALLLNEAERIAEVTSANIFWVRKGKVYTPGLDEGCLDGVTRRKVIAACKRLSIPIMEKRGTLRDLQSVDEIFISSSLKLVVGVRSIRDGKQILSYPVGPVTTRLDSLLRAMIE